MESLSDVLDRERAAEDVLLVRDDICDMGTDALFARGTGMQNLTVIDERIRDQARVNVLDAHELGHHRNTLKTLIPGAPQDMFSMTPELAEKIEWLADSEAASICVSPERLIDAYIEGCRMPYEFADTLNMTEQAYAAWVHRQEERYGTRRFEHRGYSLTFVPMRIEEARDDGDRFLSRKAI